MNSDEYDDREHSELVMPFVCVASVGGPYHDDAFVAGYAAGLVDGNLEPRTVAAMTRMVRTEIVGQCDLIAMRHGYRMDRLAGLEDGWTHVGFTRIDEEPSTILDH